MASILNIAKSQAKANDPYEETTLLAMWKASADIGVKCTCASFSPMADYLAVGTDDGATAIMSPKNGKMISRLGTSYTKPSQSLMSALNDNGRGMAMCLKFFPAGGKPKVRVALSTGKIECFDIKTGSSNAVNTVEGQTLAMDYSSDGKWYAAGGQDTQTAEQRGHAVRLYDDASSKLVRPLEGDACNPGHSNRISCVRFRGANQLASASLDGTVKLWSTGSKDPIFTFPASKEQGGGSHAEGYFEVAGNSVDFNGDYMLVGSARPHKHLLVYDLRMNRLVSEVFWRRMKPSASKAQQKWNLAKIAHLQKSNILSASFVDGGKIVAGGTGSNTVKVFTPNKPSPNPPYPVNEGAEDESLTLRELYSAVASIQLPAAIMGIDVSSRPVIKAGDMIGDGPDKTPAKEDMKIMAIATSDGNVYGVKLPRDLPQHMMPVL
mmetsp:Transcript_20157/g.51338  ORF Transcript_20157/g.51338 Transcript_20157/m.51338 type:complete len:436 (+) Transcript_20157:112-1419(+)